MDRPSASQAISSGKNNEGKYLPFSLCEEEYGIGMEKYLPREQAVAERVNTLITEQIYIKQISEVARDENAFETLVSASEKDLAKLQAILSGLLNGDAEMAGTDPVMVSWRHRRMKSIPSRLYPSMTRGFRTFNLKSGRPLFPEVGGLN